MTPRAAVRRALSILGVLPEEDRLVALVLAYGFALGLGRAITGIAASALFLSVFTAGDLAFAYLGSALSVPLTGLAFLRQQRRGGLPRLIAMALGLLCLSLIGFRLLLATAGGAWPAMALTIWYTVIYVVVTLAFWGVANRLLTLRQGKRLFGLFGASIELAEVSGGLLSAAIVALVGAPNLLLLGIGGFAAALLLLRALARGYGPRLQDEPAEQGGAAQPERRRGYVGLILALVGISYVAYFFVDTIFADLARARNPDAEALSQLIGLTLAASSACTVLLQLGLTSRLLGRLGAGAALALLPLNVMLWAAGVASVGAPLAAFWVGLGLRISERSLRFSIDESTLQVLFQPLAPAQRSRAQTLAEGVAKPLAAGAAGAAILILTRALSLDGQGLAAVLAVIALAWSGLALLLGRAYPAALRQALSERRLRAEPLDLRDAAAVALLRDRLHSPHAGEARYALELLASLNHPGFPEALTDMLLRPEAELRLAALDMIARRGQASALGSVEQLLRVDPDAEVRAAALQVLANLGGWLTGAQLQRARSDPDPRVRLVALTAIARGQTAAQAQRDPGAGAAPGGAQAPDLIRALLADPDPAVRRAALAAAQEHAAELLPAVVAALGDRHMRSVALDVLAAIGPPALPVLQAQLTAAGGPRRQAIRAIGKIGGAAAEALLIELSEHSDERGRGDALAALEARGWRAEGALAGWARARILAEAAVAARALAILRDLGEAPDAPREALVQRALLRQLERATARALTLLALLAERAMVRRARAGMRHPAADQRAYAIEALELLAPADLRPTIMALADDLPPALRLSRLLPRHPQPQYAHGAALDAAAATGDPWVECCVCYARSSGGAANDKEQRMLSTVERVLLLKGVTLFAAIPDDELGALAAALVEEEVDAGTPIVVQGELGTAIYVIARGRVRVHIGGRTLAVQGPREVFGEIAVLNSAPRLASVTAAEAVTLLRLDQEVLYDVMSDHPAVMEGIVRTLTTYLRRSLQQIGDLDEQLRGVDAPP